MGAHTVGEIRAALEEYIPRIYNKMARQKGDMFFDVTYPALVTAALELREWARNPQHLPDLHAQIMLNGLAAWTGTSAGRAFVPLLDMSGNQAADVRKRWLVLDQSAMTLEVLALRDNREKFVEAATELCNRAREVVRIKGAFRTPALTKFLHFLAPGALPILDIQVQRALGAALGCQPQPPNSKENWELYFNYAGALFDMGLTRPDVQQEFKFLWAGQPGITPIRELDCTMWAAGRA